MVMIGIFEYLAIICAIWMVIAIPPFIVHWIQMRRQGKPFLPPEDGKRW